MGSIRTALAAFGATLLVVALLCLLGCVNSGTVVDKQHLLAYTTTTFVMSGKVLVPITTYHPESWSIKVEDGGETGWVSVDETTYDEYEVGDYYAGE